MAPATYTPASDAMDRHNYGITKRYHEYSQQHHQQSHQPQQPHSHQPQQPHAHAQHSNTSSTGGGRAWSDDEEVYLLQTRLQKMPYKHIAAHLKKTELACRLHYHQLSHGSNRRKRTASVSSGSSSATTGQGSHSPPVQAAVPSPIHEHVHVQSQSQCQSRTPSPPASSYAMSSGSVQLPAIMTNMSTPSPRLLPAILPKLSMSSMPGMSSMSASPPTVSVSAPHSAPLLPAATFTSDSARSTGAPSLRLDCSGLSAPAPAPPLASAGLHHPVDMGRLHAVYAVHRSSFWSAIASEYGHGASPAVLEQAWRSGFGGPLSSGSSAPLTPGTSPDDRELYYGAYGKAQPQDKTRISAILGIDANPRSPKEREMVRRLEEERVVVPPVA